MLKIYLKNIKFRSFHGVYKEEQIVEGDFVVNLEVSFPTGNIEITDLDATVNYELLFSLLKNEMAISTPLIESVAIRVANKVLSQFKIINSVWISIEKCNPPIERLEGSVMVSYVLNRI